MKRLYILVVFLILFSACGQSKDAGAEAETEENVDVAIEETEEEEAEEEDGFEKLGEEEAMRIIDENIASREEIMEEIQNEYGEEWFISDWALDQENDGEEFQNALAIVRESLSEIMTDDALDLLAEHYTRAYFCSCDWLLTIPADTKKRFEITEQSEHHFAAKYMELKDGYGLDTQGGFHSVRGYKKVGNTWKLDDYDTILPEEEPLYLTFEDLEETFIDHQSGEVLEFEFIEELEHEGRNYLVTLRQDDTNLYEVWDTLDGSSNSNLYNKYSNAEEDSQEDSTESDEDGTKQKESDPKAIEYEYTEEMDDFGGDWDRINNDDGNVGLVTSRPPAMDVAINDNNSIVSGMFEMISEKEARFYDEDTGCELELILNEDGELEVNELSECDTLISSPAGVYQNVGRRDM